MAQNNKNYVYVLPNCRAFTITSVLMFVVTFHWKCRLITILGVNWDTYIDTNIKVNTNHYFIGNRP